MSSKMLFEACGHTFGSWFDMMSLGLVHVPEVPDHGEERGLRDQPHSVRLPHPDPDHGVPQNARPFPANVATTLSAKFNLVIPNKKDIMHLVPGTSIARNHSGHGGG